LLFSRVPPPPRSTLFPYTTLFRSSHDGMTTCSLLPIINSCYPQVSWWPDTERHPDIGGTSVPQALRSRGYRSVFVTSGDLNWARSEEHTSELQSRGHLVCRLLLEK